MSKRQAALFFFGATAVFLLVFLGMTVHSHTRFPELTNADRIDDAVLRGKDVWHHGNCVNCHTLMGEGAYYAPDLTRITAHRGEAYLTAFMQDPARFYSEEEHRRLMTDPKLTDQEIDDRQPVGHRVLRVHRLHGARPEHESRARLHGGHPGRGEAH